jgi:stage V sporulation protein B
MRASKKFAFDISITFTASIVSMFLSFLVTILLGRYLGADNLGLYRMTSTFYMVGILIASVGIPGTITKFTAELKGDQTRFNQVVSSGLILSLILGSACTGVIYFSSGVLAQVFHMPELSFLLKMLSPVFPFALTAGVFLGLLNGLRKMGKHGIARIFQSTLMIGITVFLLSCGLGIRGAVSGIVLSSVGYCFLLTWFSRNDLTMTLQNCGATAKKVLTFGSQILGASAINLINVRADTIFIGYFLTAAAVGQYAVAVELGEFFWLIPNAVQAITYPATSEYWSRNNYGALQKMIDKSMKYTSLSLLPIALGVGVFAERIIFFIFGEGFTEAVLPLRILIIGTAVQGATVRAIGGSLTGAGRPDISLRLVIISASANIVLNALLIPRFGIAGAAATTTFSLLLSTVLGLLYIRKILQVTIDMKWITKLMGITGGALVAFSLPWTGFEVDIIILTSYIVSLFVGLTTEEDRKYFAELAHDALSLLRKIIFR